MVTVMRHGNIVVIAIDVDRIVKGPDEGLLAFLEGCPCRHPLHTHEQIVMGLYDVLRKKPRPLRSDQERYLTASGVDYVPGESYDVSFEEKYEPMLRDVHPPAEEPFECVNVCKHVKDWHCEKQCYDDIPEVPRVGRSLDWYHDGPCRCESSPPGFVAQDGVHCGSCGGVVKPPPEVPEKGKRPSCPTCGPSNVMYDTRPRFQHWFCKTCGNVVRPGPAVEPKDNSLPPCCDCGIDESSCPLERQTCGPDDRPPAVGQRGGE